jgi:hypothetical protein
MRTNALKALLVHLRLIAGDYKSCFILKSEDQRRRSFDSRRLSSGPFLGFLPNSETEGPWWYRHPPGKYLAVVARLRLRRITSECSDISPFGRRLSGVGEQACKRSREGRWGERFDAQVSMMGLPRAF